MKKLILLSVIAMSVLVARDCRYEEQEFDMLIRQYEDLLDEYKYEDKQRVRRQLYDATNPYNENYDPGEALAKNLQEEQDLSAKYDFKFNRLNKRIKQQEQRLNNCRNSK